MNYSFLIVLSIVAVILGVPMFVLAEREARERRRLMSTAKVRVQDLKVGDHASMVATGIEMAIMAIDPNVPGSGVDRFGKPITGPKTRLSYVNRATKLLGHICLDPDVMVIFDEWPYGPRDHHQECCKLFSGALECDCAASDASDTRYGDGAWPTPITKEI